MKRRRLVLALGGILGVVAVVLGYGLYRMQARRNIKDVLPTFSEPGPGPRAPSTRALGFALGESSLESVRRRLSAAGLDCPDTSMRALMQQGRDQTRKEMEARKARGEDPDAVSGASRVSYRSPKEANPQVRLACSDVPASKVDDAERPPSTGRLLLIFDSPRHPLRHVSFERTYPSTEVARAIADLDATRRRLGELFGRREETATAELPWLSPKATMWTFADLEVKASAINWGPRGVVISEIVEVPWPVRADAPARKTPSVANRNGGN